MTFEELHNLLNKAYLMGFNNTCEGYNGEYPFDDKEINPEDDKGWVERRDANVNELVRTNKEEEKEVFNPCITKEQWTEWATKTYPEALERAEKLLGDLFSEDDNPYVFDPTKEPNGFTRPRSRAEVEAIIEDFELEERKANKEGEE